MTVLGFLFHFVCLNLSKDELSLQDVNISSEETFCLLHTLFLPRTTKHEPPEKD